MERKILIRNSATCVHCGDEIESRHRHDFVRCNCGQSFVDGGFDYTRFGGAAMCTAVYDNGDHKLRRSVIKWGRNYDENMQRLSKTELILIKDLKYDHIEAILDTVFTLSEFMKEVMETELFYRDLIKVKTSKKK